MSSLARVDIIRIGCSNFGKRLSIAKKAGRDKLLDNNSWVMLLFLQ